MTSGSFRERVFALSLLGLFALPAHAVLDGARVYWPIPKNTNIVTGHYLFGTANVSWSNWSRVTPSLSIDSQTYLLTYTRTQPIFGRTTFWQLIMPASTIDTSSLLPDSTQDTFVNGLGDISLGGTINLFGAPSLKAKEFIRYDLDLNVNFGVTFTFPTGQYEGTETLNVGSNQRKTRFSLPIVKSLGAWAPGKRWTFEVMPALVRFGDNDDVLGLRLEQEDLETVEIHLTRDMTQQAFFSLDYTWLEGGEETLFDPASGAAVSSTGGLDAELFGATFGFEINDHLKLFVTHMQTLRETNEDDLTLEGSLTKISLSWAWHDVLEKTRQFRRH